MRISKVQWDNQIWYRKRQLNVSKSSIDKSELIGLISRPCWRWELRRQLSIDFQPKNNFCVNLDIFIFHENGASAFVVH